jgi:integrase
MARKRRRAPNDGGSIDQLPSGLWRLRVRLEGRQVAHGLFGSEQEAFQAQARWRLVHLLPDDDPQLPEEDATNVAVAGTRCSEWFELWQKAKSERRSVVRVGRGRGGAESTAARDRAQWASWWAARIGERLPQTVTRANLAGVLREMEAVGRAPNTVRTQWVMIRDFFNWLVESQVLPSSPADGVALAVDAAADRVRQIVVPDFRFLDILAGRLRHPEDRLIFELLLGTGGRRSEVAGMRVGDVDLAAKRVWVRQPVVEVEGRAVRNHVPKGGHARAVTLGPQLAALLRDHLARMGPTGPEAALFGGPRGGGLRWNNYLPRHLRPAIEAAAARWAVLERRRLVAEGGTKPEAAKQALAEAAELRQLTPHHLRHTAAALLWAAGASDIEVQLVLGHADIETSGRLYGHLLVGSGEPAVARVEQLRQARRLS